MKRTVSFILIVSIFLSVYSQKIAKVSASYTYYAPETMSVEEAKRTALVRAKIQAIADEFGTVVTQSNSTIVSNKNGQSHSQFFSLGRSDVKGEWIETIGEPSVEVNFTDNILVVKVNIKGKVRAIEKCDIPLIAKLYRNQVVEQAETDCFMDGDHMLLTFQTPIEGSLIVYLIDYSVRQAYCLLPYSNSSLPSYEVKNDIQYTFFSENNAINSNDETVDEYLMTCSSDSIEHNEIVIIFSPDKLVKNNSIRISSSLPRQMSLEEYSTWLSKIKTSKSEIYTINKSITINQKCL